MNIEDCLIRSLSTAEELEVCSTYCHVYYSLVHLNIFYPFWREYLFLPLRAAAEWH